MLEFIAIHLLDEIEGWIVIIISQQILAFVDSMYGVLLHSNFEIPKIPCQSCIIFLANSLALTVYC